MKKIINTNNKRLTFPKVEVSFEPNEIKTVIDEHFEILIRNLWIQEVFSKKEIDKKGRRNKK